MALHFIAILIIIALFQILGGVMAWLILEKFHRYNKIALGIEMLLMLVVVIELLRQGFEVTNLVIYSLLGGFVLVFLINKFIPHKHECDRLGRVCYLVFIAMLMHELPEGLAFGSSYAVNPSMGIIVAVIIGLHNLPEGGIVALPYLIKKKTKHAFKALIATQIAFIFGGLIAYGLLINFSDIVQAHFMTFAAGMMLFIVIEEGMFLKK